MKDILLIFPALLSFVTGYLIMKKIEKLLGFFQKKHPETEPDKEVKAFYQGFWKEEAS